MVQRGECLGFPLEPRDAFGISSHRVGEDLKCYIPVKLAISSTVNLPHATSPNGSEDLVCADADPGRQGHSSTGWRHDTAPCEILTSLYDMLMQMKFQRRVAAMG